MQKGKLDKLISVRVPFKEILKKGNFYYMKVFKYDDRPRIEAAKLPDKVPEKIKRRRLLKLIREFHELVK